MTARLFPLFLAIAAPAFAQPAVPVIAFDSVPDFPSLPPGFNLGEVPGVAVNSQGHLFVFTRSNTAGGPAYGAAAAQLLEFGPAGEFIREIGKGLYAWSEAHSVRIDRQDNIWAIDKGSDMVIKFNPAGRVVWTFGRRAESADENAKPWEHPDPPLPPIDGLFRQPTDVAWDGAGNIYITDGYINSRVAKYSAAGDWLKSWGDQGAGPGQFRLPHSIVIDRNDNLYVGDRTNRRIQVFNTDGQFLRQFTIDVPPSAGTRAVNGATPTGDRLAAVSGAPNSICITPGASQVLFVGESTFPGRIFKVSLEGKVLGVIGESGRNLKQFSGAHQLACPSENELYVAETSNWRVQKLILHPEGSPLRVFASNGVKAVALDLLPRLESATGHRIEFTFDTTVGLRKRIAAGERWDAAVVTAEAIDALIQEGALSRATRTDLARIRVGVGYRTGARAPAVATAAEMKATLLGARSITYAAEGASRATVDRMIERLGLAAELKQRTALSTGSAASNAAVAAGESELILTLVSEILPAPGVTLAGPLPEEFQSDIVFTGAVNARSANAAAAAVLLNSLKATGAASLYRTRGMEPR